MITTNNYFENSSAIKFSSLPESIQKGHEFLVKATNNGESWEMYESSEAVKKTIDLYLAKLNEVLHTSGKSTEKQKEQATKKAKHRKEERTEPVKPAKQENNYNESDARELAKRLLSPFVKRGDSLRSFGTGRISGSTKRNYVQVHKDIVNVPAVNGKKVDFTFSLKELYNEIKEENQSEGSDKIAMVERIPEELRFIKRFASLNGKTKTKEDVLRFVNSLQKAILEKRIRKTSPYAKQIEQIQDKLISTYNSMKAKHKFDLKPSLVDELKALTQSQKLRLSVNFIKSYISLNGKQGMKKKAANLLKRIDRSVDKFLIPADDPYMDELIKITNNLEQFLSKSSIKVLAIEKNELNGLQGILGSIKKKKSLYDTKEKKLKAIRKKGNIITFKEMFYPRGTSDQGYRQIIVTGIRKERSGAIKIEGRGYDSNWYDNVEDLIAAIDWEFMENAHAADGLDGCNCHLNGRGKIPAVMNSMDFSKLHFKTLGFTGKWLDFIGDPSSNFTAMVFGKPKFGKSTLCLDFATYLAENHGKVIYVAREEGLDRTLQDKINNNAFKHPNMDVTSEMQPDDFFAPYDFIFLDSINRLGLTPDDLRRLKKRYPNKSFIYVFQSTKGGAFRGENTFQHDVDIIIEVPEWGHATQMGRFNQGGTMDIFSDGLSTSDYELSGTGTGEKKQKNVPKSKGREKTLDSPQPFFYVIDLNERGGFKAHVEDYLGNSVFEIRAGNELELGETSIFEDGWMKDVEDTLGLANYLKDLGIINTNDWVSHSVRYKHERSKNYNSKRYLQTKD